MASLSWSEEKRLYILAEKLDSIEILCREMYSRMWLGFMGFEAGTKKSHFRKMKYYHMEETCALTLDKLLYILLLMRPL
jgi:hypothetical protein